MIGIQLTILTGQRATRPRLREGGGAAAFHVGQAGHYDGSGRSPALEGHQLIGDAHVAQAAHEASAHVF